MEANESLRWQRVLEANPECKRGQYNPERKGLLAPGVFVDVSVLTASSWLSAFREKLTAQGIRTDLFSPDVEGMDPVRVTILDVPEETKADAVDGRISVEIDGVQGKIYASVFYNCIGEPQPGKVFYSGSNFPGFGETCTMVEERSGRHYH